MVREIVHDCFFLAMKSEEASTEDSAVATDLLDTLKAHSEGCIGMAANMIGIRKRIIVIDDCGKYTVMFNPVIVKAEGKYETEEGCLSLKGVRKTERFSKIRVEFTDSFMRPRVKNYQGLTAQIIQHEIDHCNGKQI